MGIIHYTVTKHRHITSQLNLNIFVSSFIFLFLFIVFASNVFSSFCTIHCHSRIYHASRCYSRYMYYHPFTFPAIIYWTDNVTAYYCIPIPTQIRRNSRMYVIIIIHWTLDNNSRFYCWKLYSHVLRPTRRMLKEKQVCTLDARFIYTILYYTLYGIRMQYIYNNICARIGGREKFIWIIFCFILNFVLIFVLHFLLCYSVRVIRLIRCATNKEIIEVRM